jgi:mannose-6-phosphate isomerase
VIAAALAEARRRSGAEWSWVQRLAKAWPDDLGVIAPLLLDLVVLAPGEALFLDAGCLHSYLEGVGVELMGNSDNVLRGGLTRKHVDVPALLDTLAFRCAKADPLHAARVSSSESRYATSAQEFTLSLLQPESGEPYVSPSVRSVEILLCTEGQGSIRPGEATAAPLPVQRGATFLVPAAAAAYRLEGRCSVWKAAVPTSSGLV